MSAACNRSLRSAGSGTFGSWCCGGGGALAEGCSNSLKLTEPEPTTKERRRPDETAAGARAGGSALDGAGGLAAGNLFGAGGGMFVDWLESELNSPRANGLKVTVPDSMTNEPTCPSGTSVAAAARARGRALDGAGGRGAGGSMLDGDERGILHGDEDNGRLMAMFFT